MHSPMNTCSQSVSQSVSQPVCVCVCVCVCFLVLNAVSDGVFKRKCLTFDSKYLISKGLLKSICGLVVFIDMNTHILTKDRNFNTSHCLKSVRIRSYSGPHFPAFRLITDQNNSEYGHFSRSVLERKPYNHFGQLIFIY